MGHEIAGEIVSLDDVGQENLEGRVNALETTVEEIRTEIRDFRTATTVSFNALREDFGDDCLDIVVHSLANGPEVQDALLVPGHLRLQVGDPRPLGDPFAERQRKDRDQDDDDAQRDPRSRGEHWTSRVVALLGRGRGWAPF